MGVEQLITNLNLTAESPFVLERVIARMATDLAELYVAHHGMGSESARIAAADRVRQHLDAARGRTPESPYGHYSEG